MSGDGVPEVSGQFVATEGATVAATPLLLLLNFHHADLSEVRGSLAVEFIAQHFTLRYVSHAQQFKHGEVWSAPVGHLQFRGEADGFSATFFARSAEWHAISSTTVTVEIAVHNEAIST